MVTPSQLRWESLGGGATSPSPSSAAPAVHVPQRSPPPRDAGDDESGMKVPHLYFTVPAHVRGHHAQPFMSMTSATGFPMGHAPNPRHFQCRGCGSVGTYPIGCWAAPWRGCDVGVMQCRVV